MKSIDNFISTKPTYIRLVAIVHVQRIDCCITVNILHMFLLIF